MVATGELGVDAAIGGRGFEVVECDDFNADEVDVGCVALLSGSDPRVIGSPKGQRCCDRVDAEVEADSHGGEDISRQGTESGRQADGCVEDGE